MNVCITCITKTDDMNQQGINEIPKSADNFILAFIVFFALATWTTSNLFSQHCTTALNTHSGIHCVCICAHIWTWNYSIPYCISSEYVQLGDFMVSEELSEHKLQYVAFSNSTYSFIGTSIFLHSFSHQHVHIHQHICIKYSRNKHIGLLFLPRT